jgi:septum formation protein
VTRPGPRRLVLASASPRRRELLGLLGLEFETVVPGVDELRGGDPADVVVENARRKALAGAELVAPDSTVIGVDTDVALDGALLGKAADRAGAGERLRALSGRTHEVLSGVVVVGAGEIESRLARTAVTFRELSADEIDAYLESGEWDDRAGAYAVQGLGSAFVARVEGDLSNVIGLPIPTLGAMIADLQNR